MPSSEDIDLQRELLHAHRRTLAAYLKQQALAGGAQSAPIAVINGIAATRAEIARVKAILSDWGADVVEHPDDATENRTARGGQAAQSTVLTRWQGWQRPPAHVWDIVRWWTLATSAGSAVGYGVSRGPGLALTELLGEANVHWSTAYLVGYAVMGALVGVGCGIGQWVVQRHRGWRGRWWVGVCAVAHCFGWGIATSVEPIVNHVVGADFGDMAVWGFAGIVIGLIQWLALPYIQRAGWWILANALGWALGWTLGDTVIFAAGLNWSFVGHVVGGLLGGMIGGTVVGLLTGNILVGMMGPFPIATLLDENEAAGARSTPKNNTSLE